MSRVIVNHYTIITWSSQQSLVETSAVITGLNFNFGSSYYPHAGKQCYLLENIEIAFRNNTCCFWCCPFYMALHATCFALFFFGFFGLFNTRTGTSSEKETTPFSAQGWWFCKQRPVNVERKQNCKIYEYYWRRVNQNCELSFVERMV